ncbi:MAG: type II toxin-antitoxin system HipA family toxin [Wenzhouxiangella sp.]|nr:MAG: type II toxin-antitoxin system HipA family toxin [Wenzhouxiangella sp.]
MADLAIIEIFRDGQWLPSASLEPLGGEHARVDYLPEYVFDQEKPWPISLTFPVQFGVSFDHDPRPQLPAFLYDLVPQGPGRKLLVELLGLRDHDGLGLPLLLAGAFNPIGALRIDQAVSFHESFLDQQALPANFTRGFRLVDLVMRQPEVIESLSAHAMLSAGTTGVQGAAPKFLLSADADGLLHPDMALADSEARSHWLVKGPRGRHRDDHLIIRAEAAYLRVAAACGLHVHRVDQIIVHGNWLQLPRFDRQVDDHGVHRLAQESLASLAGLQGFGKPCSLNRLLGAIREHSSAPMDDTLEFMKRDVLNQALRNTDNHARNHAMQRLPNGEIRLTPLFDFAPMFRDPELIPRALHWIDHNGRRLRDWSPILEALKLPDSERTRFAGALSEFAETVARLPEIAKDNGVDNEILDACRYSIENQAESLARLN